MGGGFLCYDVWDAHIGLKQGPKVVFDPSKNEINVTIILFSGSIFEIWWKIDFSSFYSIFKHNKRFLHNIMIF